MKLLHQNDGALPSEMHKPIQNLTTCCKLKHHKNKIEQLPFVGSVE